MTILDKFRAALKLGPSIINRRDLAAISDNWDVDVKAVDKHIGLAAKHTYLADELLTIKPETVTMTILERSASLKAAYQKVGVDLHGGFAFAPGNLKEAIERAANPAHREYWMGESAGLMRTMIDQEPEIAELLEEDGILVWVSDDDDVVRIVNVRWLVDEAEIHDFVTTEPVPGKRCRFCTALEGPHSFALQPLDPDRRNKDALIGAASGQPVQTLIQGLVHTHPECAPYWLEWVKIAERFAEGGGMSIKLTAKQRRFVEEYLVDQNATQAAIRAGYSERTAKEMGYENLTKPHIADAIQAEGTNSRRLRNFFMEKPSIQKESSGI